MRHLSRNNGISYNIFSNITKSGKSFGDSVCLAFPKDFGNYHDIEKVLYIFFTDHHYDVNILTNLCKNYGGDI